MVIVAYWSRMTSGALGVARRGTVAKFSREWPGASITFTVLSSKQIAAPLVGDFPDAICYAMPG